MNRLGDLHVGDFSQNTTLYPFVVPSFLPSVENQDPEITGADIAATLRAHLKQISEEVQARYNQFYTQSINTIIDQGFAHEWASRELSDFFDCIEKNGTSNGNYTSWVGDAVALHYEILSPLVNRIEMIQLYAEVCANYVWEAYVGDSTQLNEATTVFEQCVENLLYSDIEGFAKATLVQGALGKTWKLGPRKSIDPLDISNSLSPEKMKDFSPRQLQIIQLVAEGHSNGEIAATLDISPNTVKNHLVLIFNKLNVNSRTELALHAVREGFVQNSL